MDYFTVKWIISQLNRLLFKHVIRMAQPPSVLCAKAFLTLRCGQPRRQRRSAVYLAYYSHTALRPTATLRASSAATAAGEACLPELVYHIVTKFITLSVTKMHQIVTKFFTVFVTKYASDYARFGLKMHKMVTKSVTFFLTKIL